MISPRKWCIFQLLLYIKDRSRNIDGGNQVTAQKNEVEDGDLEVPGFCPLADKCQEKMAKWCQNY
jgi:hypothetical protein